MRAGKILCYAVLLWWLQSGSTGYTQYTFYHQPSIGALNPTPQSYTQYYNQNLQSYYRPSANVRDYTIDRYFYHDPNLSPYLNLTRRTGASNLNNYYRYVVPEIERRDSLAPVAPPPKVNFNSNPYFNHYYNPNFR